MKTEEERELQSRLNFYAAEIFENHPNLEAPENPNYKREKSAYVSFILFFTSSLEIIRNETNSISNEANFLLSSITNNFIYAIIKLKIGYRYKYLTSMMS